MSKLPVTPLSQLANFIDKQQVVCIEGKIVAVYPKKEGEGQYGKWVMQDVNLSGDGVEHKITIGDDKKLLTDADKGKTVRISAGTDKKGQLSGLQYEVKESGDKVYRKVKVGAWAKVEFLGAGGEPLAGNTSGSSSNRSTGSQSGNTSHSSGGRNGAQVGNAINNATLLLAHSFYPLPAGADPLVHLENTAKQILAIADRLEKTPPSPSTESKIIGWKEIVNPYAKDGKTLGDATADELKQIIKWRYKTLKAPEGKENFYNNILMAAAESGWDQVSLIMDAGGDISGLEKLTQQNFAKPASQLDEGEWATIYSKFDEMVEKTKQLAGELSDSDFPPVMEDFDDIPF